MMIESLRRISAPWILAPLLILQDVCAYDLHTHGAMTSEAIAQSNFGRDFNASPIARRLGLSEVPVADINNFVPLGQYYFDLGSTLLVRSANPPSRKGLEGEVFANLRDDSTGLILPPPYAIESWIIRGAIQEDDNGSETPDSDEPGGPFSRVFAHFFDPYGNRGMAVSGVRAEPTSMAWATDSSALVYELNPFSSGRSNHLGIPPAFRTLPMSA